MTETIIQFILDNKWAFLHSILISGALFAIIHDQWRLNRKIDKDAKIIAETFDTVTQALYRLDRRLRELTQKYEVHDASLCDFREAILTRIPDRIKKLEDQADADIAIADTEISRLRGLVFSHSQTIAQLEQAISKPKKITVKPAAIIAARKPHKKANGRAHANR